MIFRPSFLFKNTFKTQLSAYHKGYKAISLLSLACFFYGISAGMNDSSFSLFLDRFNLAVKDISLILSFEVLGNIAISPFIIILISRFGLYNLILISLILRNTCLAIFGLGDNLDIWYCSMFGFGIGGFILHVGLFQWINSIAENHSRATFLSFASFAYGLGVALGPFLITLSNISLGHMTFIISLCICNLMLVPLIRAKNYKPQNYEHHKISITKLLKFARLPILCALAGEYIYFSIAEFLPFYALGQGKLQNEAYMFAGYFTLSGLILSIPLGMLIDKFNRLKMVIIFALIIAVLIQLVPNVINNTIYILVIFAFLSTSIDGVIISGLAILGDKFKNDDFVAANSMVHAISAIGGYAGVTATGFAMDKIGDHGLIFSISASFLVFLTLLLIEAYKSGKQYSSDS